MGLSTRPSNPAILAARSQVVPGGGDNGYQVSRWGIHPAAGGGRAGVPAHERQFGLLVDIMIEVAGPLRREGAELWFDATDAYGRLAAIRGLAAGEVVEEIQHLRELLIRSLSEPIFSMPARQSMAVLLRLNRIVDKGISHAVVGYTDELVETLFDRRGVPVTAAEPADVVIDERLDQLENELVRLKLDHPA